MFKPVTPILLMPPAPTPPAVFVIPQVPGIMKANGFFPGATLLEKWLNDPACNDPNRGIPDTTTITMDWVLRFQRARDAYDSIFTKKLWCTENAKAKIAALLAQLGKVQQPKSTFGNFKAPTAIIDHNYVQFVAVGDMLRDPIDGLFVALGRFPFRIAVKGFTSQLVLKPGMNLTKITIEEVAVYVRDSFDFNDWTQPLGFWDPKGNRISKLPIRNGVFLSDLHFRAWRAFLGKGKGGDFLIYSDAKVTPLAAPKSFYYEDYKGKAKWSSD